MSTTTLTWRQTYAQQPAHLMVTILPEGMSFREYPAGVIGAATEKGSVAYAFFGRIRRFAYERNLLQATQLLLGEGHGPSGLMRAKWIDPELVQARLGLLGFTATQGLRIRSGLDSPSALK